jgi:predicted transcriptional regulator
MTLASSILASLLAGQQPPSLDPAALNQLSRFKAKGWISVQGVKGNRTYALTNVGRIVAVVQAQQEATEAFIEAHRDFLQSHDISGIPTHLLPRLGELVGSPCDGSAADPLASLKNFLDDMRQAKYILGLSPNVMDGYTEVITDRVEAGYPIELILTSEVIAVLDDNMVRDWLRHPNFHLYDIERATLSFACMDRGFNIGLPLLNGKYDLSSDLACNETALPWGLELFEWYKKQAREIKKDG